MGQLKPNSPELRAMRGQEGKLPILGRELGVFSRVGVAPWLHLTECYIQLQKFPTAEKCIIQVFTLLGSYLDEMSLSTVVPEEDDLKINEGLGDGSLLSDLQ